MRANRSQIIGALALLFLAAAHPASADSFHGRVVALSDGDTVTVLDSANTQHKVRLAGIDAPERRQPFGTKAREHLSSLVFGKRVTVEWEKRDRYQRYVGKVLVEGKDASLELIRLGMAWHYKQYAREQTVADRSKYSALEKQARAQGVGLWADPNPIPPWQFRRRSRNQEKA